MTTAQLIREPWQPGNKETLGWLRVAGRTFCTLELPWLGNRRNVSCIPAGAYAVSFIDRTASGKYKRVYHVQNVENRGGILFHSGNISSHSRGCILVGMKHGVLGKRRAVLQSRMGMRGLHAIIGDNTFKLEIYHV